MLRAGAHVRTSGVRAKIAATTLPQLAQCQCARHRSENCAASTRGARVPFALKDGP
jgi:hypothetical protein